MKFRRMKNAQVCDACMRSCLRVLTGCCLQVEAAGKGVPVELLNAGRTCPAPAIKARLRMQKGSDMHVRTLQKAPSVHCLPARHQSASAGTAAGSQSERQLRPSDTASRGDAGGNQRSSEVIVEVSDPDQYFELSRALQGAELKVRPRTRSRCDRLGSGGWPYHYAYCTDATQYLICRMAVCIGAFPGIDNCLR